MKNELNIVLWILLSMLIHLIHAQNKTRDPEELAGILQTDGRWSNSSLLHDLEQNFQYNTDPSGNGQNNMFSIDVDPSAVSFGAAGGCSLVSWNAQANWSVTALPDWIVVYPENGGTGSGSLTLNASPKATYGSRNGTITLQSGSTSQNITVTQQGAPPLLTINSATFDVGRRGGSKYFEVDANLAWTATRDQTWFIVSPANGDGDGAFSIIAEVNTTPNARNGTVTVTGGGITRIITVTQEAQGPFITVSPTGATYSSAGGSKTFTIESNVSWNVTIRYIGTLVASGSNNGSFTFSLGPNNLNCEDLNWTLVVNGGAAGNANIHIRQNKKGGGICQ